MRNRGLRLPALALASAGALASGAEATAGGSVALRAYQPDIRIEHAQIAPSGPVQPRPVVVAARLLPARHVVAPEDVRVEMRRTALGMSTVDLAVGRETATAVPEGQALRAEALLSPAIIDRNDRVLLQYRRGPLTIRVEGRALERAAAGKRIAAMNLASRQTVMGTAAGPGLVEVSE